MKHWKHHSKRGLALFLVLMMCMSLFPTTAFAVDGEHVHNDSCVKVERICGLEEHEHEDACYVSEEPQCSDPDAHQHTDECYDEDGALICDEPDAHQHEDACYVAQEPQCGKEAHQHDDDCYRWDCSGSEETEEIEEIEEVPEEVTAFVEAMKDIPEASAIDESNAAEIQEALFDEVLSDGWAMVDNNMEAAWITEEILAAYDKYTAVFTATEDVLENGNNPYYNWIQGKILNLGTVTKHVGESGFYQRLPRLTFTCRGCGGVVHEVIPGTDYDADSWTDEEFLDNIRLLPNGPYKGGAASGDDFYIGDPCFEFDYRGIKPTNSTKVDIDLYYCYNAYSVSGSCDFCGNWVTTSSNYNIYKDDITFYVRIEGDYALMFKDGAKAAPDVNGMPGEVRERNTTATSKTLTVPNGIPTRSGYDFLGWFDKNDVKHEAGEQITLNWDTADKDMTTGTAYMELTAKWQCNHPKDADGNCTDPDCDHEEDCCKPATEYTVIREYYIDGKLEATKNTSTKAKAKDVIVGADLAAKNPSWKTENIGGVSHTFDYVSCNPTPSITLVKDATKNVITLRYEKAATYKVIYKDGLDSKLFGDVTYGRTEDESKLLGVGDPTTPCKNLAQYIQWGADRELAFTGWELTSGDGTHTGWQKKIAAADANTDNEIIYTAQWLKWPKANNTATNLVKVHCETNSGHQDAVYGLLTDGFTAAAPVKGADGVWTSVVTITTDTYVTAYNGTPSTGHTFDSAEPSNKQITLKWDPTADNGNGQKGQWVAQTTDSQVVIKVTCTPTTPKLDVKKLAMVYGPDGTTLKYSPAKSGDIIKYMITVTNTTSEAVTDVTVTDELDSNLTFVSATSTSGGMWTEKPADDVYEIGELKAVNTKPGDNRTLTITVKVNDNIPTTVTSIRNTAEASYNGQTPTDPKCTGSTDVTVDAFKPKLTVDKDVLVNGASVKDTALPRGTVVTYKVVVKNTGNCALKDLVITDFMDQKVTLKQESLVIDDGGKLTSAKYWAPTTTEGEILQFKGTLAKDGTITLTYQATVTAYDGKNVENHAYATANADKTVSGGSGTTSTTGGINPSSIQVGFAGLPALMLTNNPMRFVGLGLTTETDGRPNEDTITNGSQVSDNASVIVQPQARTFTVTFNSQGGSAVNPQTITEEPTNDQKATQPASDPTKSDFVFGGWYREAACTNAWDFDTVVTGDITLYAKWTPKDKVDITIKYVDSKDSTKEVQSSKTVSVVKGEAYNITDEQIGTVPGYAIISVSDNRQGADAQAGIVVTVTCGVDAYGPKGPTDPTKDDKGDGIPDIWQPVVTYKVSGGTWDGTDATDKAYVFNLWEKDATGAWEAKQPTLGSTVPTGTPQAGYKNDGGKWSTTDGTLPGTTPVTENAAYTLTFTQATVKATNTDGTDAGTWKDGDSNAEKTLTPDADGKVTLPEITPPIGKELDKWVDQDGNEFDPSKPVDKNLELKPVWKNIGLSIDPAELTVVYDGNGHAVTPSSIVVRKNAVPVAAGDATVTIGGYTDAANNPISGNPVNVGTYKAAITATVDGQTVNGTATVTIERRTLNVTTGSANRVYNGSPLTNTSITITGQAPGESITGRTTGSQTNPGSSANGYTLTWGAGVLSSNYNVVATLGTLTVNAPSTTPTNPGNGGGGGGGGGGGRPGTNPTNPGAGNTTTIGDTEVPLAGDLQLNKTDHFAYIKGYQDGTVRPNNPITRAQVATIFYRLLDETSRVIYFQETNDFTDVANDYWANKAISTLTNAGIITGFSDGTFRPNAYITRAQFAAIAARFDNVVPGLNNPFTDVAEDYWARDLIAFAADRGWITGESGKFRPLENITRVEVMDFINNVLERHVDEQGLLENATKWSDVPVTDPNYYVVEEATNSHDYTRRTEGQLMENWTQLNPDPVWDE